MNADANTSKYKHDYMIEHPQFVKRTKSYRLDDNVDVRLFLPTFSVEAEIGLVNNPPSAHMAATYTRRCTDHEIYTTSTFTQRTEATWPYNQGRALEIYHHQSTAMKEVLFK